jgi:hypothetical protein
MINNLAKWLYTYTDKFFAVPLNLLSLIDLIELVG